MTRRTLSLLALCAVLSGCSIMPSWLGGTEKEKPKLPGERIAVLPVGAGLAPDTSLTAMPFALPPAATNADWPHSGAITADAGNLAGGSFTQTTSATAGDGNAFKSTLVPQPVVASGTVFAMDASGYISAHDAADITKIHWQSKGVSEEDDPPILGGGLAYDGGKLYAVSGLGTVAALDAATGKPVWRKKMDLSFFSAPQVAGGKLFVLTLDNQIYALSAATGDVLWNQRGISETSAIMTPVSPAVAEDTVIAPYSSGEIYALSATDGHELWNDSMSPGPRIGTSSFFGGIGGDPVIDGSVVFAVSSGGAISVLSLAAGQHAWDRPIGAINTPWLAGNYMYLLTTDNEVICFLKFDGRIRWSRKLRDYKDEKDKRYPIIWRGPVVTSGRAVVIGSNGQLLLISAETGAIEKTLDIPENIFTAPVIAGGRMYLIGQDATLYELQ